MDALVIMPRQGQSVESCILTEWKVNVGDQVAEGDVLAVIETDKASFDLESTASGTVLALFWEADDDACLYSLMLPPLGTREKMWRNFARKDKAVPRHLHLSQPHRPQRKSFLSQLLPQLPPTEASAPTGSISASSGVSPRARRLAHKHGIDAESLPGSGPSGRVIERDVEAAISGRPRLSATARARSLSEDLESPARGSEPWQAWFVRRILKCLAQWRVRKSLRSRASAR